MTKNRLWLAGLFLSGFGASFSAQAQTLDSLELNLRKSDMAFVAESRVHNREILVFPRSAPQSGTMMVHAKLGTFSVSTNPANESFYTLKVDPSVTLAEAINTLNADSEVEWAQPNFIYHTATTTPSDTSFAQQWAYSNTNQTVSTGLGSGSESTYGTNNPPGAAAVGKDINATRVWDYVTDCSATTVAIIDSGIVTTHPELSANLWQDPGDSSYGYDFVNNDSNPTDDYGHGTFVASLVGGYGNNASKGTGVCWRAKMMAVKVADKTGTSTSSTLIGGINYAVSKGSKILLLASSAAAAGSIDYALKDAITLAGTSGALVIVPAGNATSDVSTANIYPCKFGLSNMLCVAGVDQNFALVSNSNYNSTYVNLAAPGANIRGGYPFIATSSSVDFSTWVTPATTSDFYNAGTNATGQWAQSGTSNLQVPWNWDGSSTNYSTNKYSYVFSPSADYSAYSKISASISLTAASFTTGRDSFTMAYSAAGTNPFAVDYTNTTLFAIQDAAAVQTKTIDMTTCAVSTCSFGFLLKSDNTTTAATEYGLRVNSMTLNFTAASSTTETIFTGTSAAAAFTAGTAALVLSQATNMSMTQLRNAVLNGSTVNALSTSVASGTVLNVYGAYSFINTVTGLGATIY